MLIIQFQSNIYLIRIPYFSGTDIISNPLCDDVNVILQNIRSQTM